MKKLIDRTNIVKTGKLLLRFSNVGGEYFMND